MPDDHGVIFAGRNAGTEFLPVGRLEIFLCRDKDVCTGIEPEEVAPPLLNQVVGDDIQALLGQSQAPAFHARGDHLEGLPGADAVCQERIAAIEDMSYSVFLVLHEGDLRRHPDKAYVGAVILPGAGAVEQFIVLFA